MTTQRRIEAAKRNRAKRGPLSPEARQRLREAALRNKPWRHSTGPRTAEGKHTASRNSLKHGRYAAQMRAWRRDALRFLRLSRLFRSAVLGAAYVDDAHALVSELAELSRRLRHQGPPMDIRHG